MKKMYNWPETLQLSPNFTLGEMTYSERAEVEGIDNSPNGMVISHLRKLCTRVLQPIRDHFQRPIRIYSGYRSFKLNSVLSGTARHSRHVFGQAADFRVVGVSHRVVIDWIVKNLDFDVVMIEYPRNDTSNPNRALIHVSFVDRQNRRIDLTSAAVRKTFMLSPNFSLWELTHSATAEKLGIYNVPNEGGIERLQAVCKNVLQPVRDHFAKPVTVNSGFRSPALNAAIKGAARNSQHVQCEAADYEIIGVDNHELANWVSKNLDYDKLILEYHGDDSPHPNDGWVHTSYVEPPRVNRKQNLTIDNAGTRSGIAEG